MKTSRWYHIIRLKQWTKNVLVWAPAFFSGQFLDKWYENVWGFLAFSLTASAVYVVNDIRDRPYDEFNPAKHVSDTNGKWLFALSTVLGMLGLVIALWLSSPWPLLLYVIINLSYTFGVKTIPYIEVLIVSSGFLLRILFGGQIADIEITPWLYGEVLILTLLIVLSKRIKEVKYYSKTGVALREAITSYSLNVLQVLFGALIAMIIIIYTAYCFNGKVMARTHSMIWLTLPVVILGIYRFIQLTVQTNQVINPIQWLFKDGWLQGLITLWILMWVLLIYYV